MAFKKKKKVTIMLQTLNYNDLLHENSLTKILQLNYIRFFIFRNHIIVKYYN